MGLQGQYRDVQHNCQKVPTGWIRYRLWTVWCGPSRTCRNRTGTCCRSGQRDRLTCWPAL